MTQNLNKIKTDEPIVRESWLKRTSKLLLKKFLERLFFWFVIMPYRLIKELIFWAVTMFLLLTFYFKAIPWIANKIWGKDVPALLKFFIPSLFTLCLMLTGCSTSHQKPADIGTGTDDLKKSVCAQCTKEPFYKDGQWLTERRI